MLKVYVDGSCRGNPGIGGIGIVIKGIEESNQIVGDMITNNEAEYYALIEGIKRILLLNEANENVVIYTDSALIHGQMVLDWKNNYPHLVKLHDIAEKLISEAPFKIKIEKIKRLSTKEHSRANDLAQEITEERKNEK
jgi:ribonuclease HI